MTHKIHFIANSGKQESRMALQEFIRRYDQSSLHDAKTVVSLGGDGTFLWALHHVVDNIPYGSRPNVLGLKYGGSIGKLLSSTALKDLPDAIDSSKTEQLTPVLMDYITPSKDQGTIYGFNDIVFHGYYRSKMCQIKIADSNKKTTINASGLIAATHMGQTAYYAAAGDKDQSCIPTDKIGVQSISGKPKCNYIVPPFSLLNISVNKQEERPVVFTADFLEPNIAISSGIVRLDPGHSAVRLIPKQKYR